MTLIPIIKKCDKCGKKYTFNPDVGKGLFCPKCLGTGLKVGKKK